jgi:hypothetical protein
MGFTDMRELKRGRDSKNRCIISIKQGTLQQAEQTFLARVNTDEFQKSVRGTVAMIMEHLKDMAAMARSLKSYGNEDDLPVLQRLLLVHFVRATYDFDPPVKETIARFLSTNPSATTEDLLVCVVRSVTIETTKRHLQHPRSFMPGFNDPKSHIVTYLGQVFEGVVDSIGKWQKQGINPTGISKGYFTVQGVDFSLSAKPV